MTTQVASSTNQQRKDGFTMHANVRFHKNDTGLVVALSTNATDEGDFLASIIDAIILEFLHRELFDLDNRPLATEAQVSAVCDLFNIQLSRILPQVIEVACRLRGYKADVVEHRVIVAGNVVPANLVELFPNELAEKA